MNRAHYLALAKTMKPSSTKVLLTSVGDGTPVEITLGHPEAGAVIPGLAANPVLIEFLFNETDDGKQALTDFNLNSILGLLKRMGPHAISAIIAASMRDEDTGNSLAGDAEIEAWIRNWSPSDQIEALLAIHEVTNLGAFFVRLWSLATTFPVGQAMASALQSVGSSTTPSSDEQASTSETSIAAPSAPDQNTNGRRSKMQTHLSSLENSASTLPFGSENPSVGSAEAA
jgi:hypothetical protein